MKPRDYCCCAIPLLNAGMYAAITEQFIVAFIVGILSMTTPSIVGAVTPSFATWVLGIVCLTGAAVQLVGFIAVYKDKRSLFKQYLAIHLILTIAALGVASAWAVLSGIRNSTAQSNCLATFFDTDDSTLRSQGETLCTIFSFVDLGIMAGLILLFTITQIYLYFVIASYAVTRKRSLAYDAADSTSPIGADSIPMSIPHSVYTDQKKPAEYVHVRQDSVASLSDVMSEPPRQPQDTFSQASYEPDPYYPSQPSNIYRQGTGPTTQYNNQQFSDDSKFQPPAGAQYR